MSQQSEGTMRRTRRIGVIAGLIIAAGALAGCSSGASDSAAPAVEGARVDNAAEADKGTVQAFGASTSDRSIVITGSIYMTVEDPMAAADEAAGIVQRAGGRIDARNEIAPDGRDGGSATLTLRIPSTSLDTVVGNLGGLGTVDQYSTQSQDVTTEVTDLAARISTLRASTARIEGLLKDAAGIPDIIKLEDELSTRQAELQSLEAQQRGLNDQVSMSTIDLSLTTEPVVIVVVDDSPKNFWDGLVSGWSGLVSFISVALVVVGVLLPWAALGGLITIGVIALVRASRARRARRAAALPAPTPPPATNPTLWANQPSAPAQSPAPAERPAPAPPAPGPTAPQQPEA